MSKKRLIGLVVSITLICLLVLAGYAVASAATPTGSDITQVEGACQVCTGDCTNCDGCTGNCATCEGCTRDCANCDRHGGASLPSEMGVCGGCGGCGGACGKHMQSEQW